jgi:hypothetical protein
MPQKGRQTSEEVAAVIAHCMKALFICLHCGLTIRGRDLRIGKGAPVKFSQDGAGIIPQFQCPRCQSWDFEMMDPPKG